MSATLTVTAEGMSTPHIHGSNVQQDNESPANKDIKLLSKASDISLGQLKTLMQSYRAVWRFPINPRNRACDKENWPPETGTTGEALCSPRSDELDRVEKLLFSKHMLTAVRNGPTTGEIKELSNSYITILIECIVAGGNLEAGSDHRFAIQELPEYSFDCPSLDSPYAKGPFVTDKQQVIVDTSDARAPTALTISARPSGIRELVTAGYALRTQEKNVLSHTFAQACTMKLSKHQGVILNHFGANVRFIEHPKGSLLGDTAPHELDLRYASYVFPSDRNRFVEDMVALILNHNDYKSVFTCDEPVEEYWNEERKEFTMPDPDFPE